jgi:hypothetical protein
MAIVTGIDATTYIDTGAVTPSGACNATDGSRAWIEHSAKFCANSSGTAFDTCIVAPAGVAANYLATLPETGTAGSLVDKAAGATVVDHIVTFSNITGRIKDSGTLLTGLAPLASPTFTGTPASVTPATADNSTAIATTAFVKANLPLKIAVSITPAATTASTCAEQTFNTFTGLATGQGVSVSPPALPGANVWIGSVRVSAANTLAIGFCANATGGTAAAGTYTAVAF